MRWTMRRCDHSVWLEAILLALLFAAPSGAAESPNGLGVETTTPAKCTRKTENGDKLNVDYRGTLATNGQEFDSSYKGSGPFNFTLGKGEVIRGWDLGLLGMCIGESRRLTIPPALAYGDRSMGLIPKGSTLVFDTTLVGIEGVEANHETDSNGVVSALDPSLASTAADVATDKDAEGHPATSTALKAESEDGPKTAGNAGADDGECRLLGPFALVVQAALGGLAAFSLVYKRWRESPRRPLTIWWFDVSKQVFGSVLLHIANLFFSMLSSGNFRISIEAKPNAAFVQDGEKTQPNPCSFYLLNLAIDTTIGIPILIVLLRLLHAAAMLTPLANPPESIKSGVYGQPPRVSWWLKQSLIYFLGLLGMKLCVFFLFAILPWIAWVGDWALRWTEGNEAVQITFVMFVFPLIMNGIQYYIIDSFIKDPAGGGEHHLVPGEDEDNADDDTEAVYRRGSLDMLSDAESLDAETTKGLDKETTPLQTDNEDRSDGRSGPSSRGRAE